METIVSVHSNVIAFTKIIKIVLILFNPNPAKDYLTIKTESQEYTEGRLYNIDGKVIIDFEFEGNLKLSVKNLKSGVYFVRLVNKNDVLTEKIIVGNEL